MRTSRKRKPVKSTEEQWAEIFNEWSISGLSDIEFCKRNNYYISAFRYMREQLKFPDPENPTVSAKGTDFQIRSDAAKQRWVRDDKKEAFWRRQIESWKKSGLSKRAFCKTKNLTESSFNAWCREIELRDREKVTSANAATLLDDTEQQPSNPFVPLHLVSNDPKQEQPDPEPGREAEPKQRISILVPGGAEIRVSDCSVSFVAELYYSLKA